MHYTVSDQIGTITELISENGYIHYRQKLNLWGEAQAETLHHKRASNDEIVCNLRFVGQYADEESGLYYNRFRYYSPETGQYVSSDPIGLLGGFNPYGYMGIPTAFVDPLGLASYSSNNPTAKNQQSQNNSQENRPPNLSPVGAGRRGAFNEAKRRSGIPTSQQPDRVLPNVDKRNNPQPGRIYEFDIPKKGGGKETIRIRDDAGGHIYPDDQTQNRGPHFNDMKGNHYDY